MRRPKLSFKNLRSLLLVSWREDKPLFFAYFISSLLGAILLYAVYFIYKLMIDEVAKQVGTSFSSTLFIVITTYLFFEYMSRFVNFTFNQYYFDYFIRAKLQNVLTRMFMEKLAKMDFAHLENGDVRNLIARIESTYAFRLPEILKTMNAVVFNIAALILSFLVALRFNIIYFLVLALVSAPVYYLRVKYGNLTYLNFAENSFNANYLMYLRSVFTNFVTLSEMKIYSLRNYFLNKTENLQQKILSDYERPLKRYTIISTVSFVLVPMAIYFALDHFIIGIKEGTYTLGDFTFFLNALFTFSGQISGILINLGSIYENSLFVNDYFHLLSIRNSITVPSNPHIFSKIEPREIVFENVSFAYPGSTNESLKDVNITIKKGENVAIVGHNGAGKSTIIKLLFRFYDPTKGRILIDGIDLKTIEVSNWYRHLGVLFQEFARYFLTLRENIIFGDIENADGCDLEKYIKEAQAQPLLKALPKKFDQFLGRWFEGGVEISGGQWQKVAIARALFRNAPILVMDEPTSNIDADAESKIFQNLRELYKNKNLIFISHRFSTVRTADNIFVLEKGKVVEKGKHEDLIKRQGLYATFFKLQKKGYE